MRLCHFLHQRVVVRRRRPREPVSDDSWQKGGLGGPLRRCSCWGESKTCVSRRCVPSGLLPMSANQQCAAGEGPSLPPSHIIRNITNLRPHENICRHSHQPPSVLLHPPSSPCLLFLKEKCERRKKQGKECSARGGRWRKPHFFRRAAASGLLRWL